MYEALWDQSPRVQQIRAESEAEGRMKGEVDALRRMLVRVVKVKFPPLTDLAEQEVERMSKPYALDMLVQQIIVADDEKLARWLLTSVKN